MIEDKDIEPHVPVWDKTQRSDESLSSLKLDRLRLRGLSGARDEFMLAAVAQNLRRLAKLMPQGPPITGIGAPA